MKSESRTRRYLLQAGGAVAATLMFPLRGMAQAREFKVLSSLAANNPQAREILKVYVDAVQAGLGGDTTFRISGPEVVPFANQFQPAAAGAFDLLFTHGAYHSGTTAIGLAIDAVQPDPAKRRSAGVFDFIDKHYNALGLKLLALAPAGSKGFQFVSKQPIKEQPGLKGMKVRGTVPYHPMIKALGGAPVVMGGGELYSALEKGVIDAAAWSLTGVSDLKLHEVAKYFVRPTFGSATWLILMNQKAWAALPPAQQKVFQDEAVKLENGAPKRFDELAVAELAELRKLGMQETNFAAADASRLEELWSEGVWEVARAKNGAVADEMRAIARKAGLST